MARVAPIGLRRSPGPLSLLPMISSRDLTAELSPQATYHHSSNAPRSSAANFYAIFASRAVARILLIGLFALFTTVRAIAADALTDNAESKHLPDTGFSGSATCATCHRKEHALWQGSHHDLAMQLANADTVLGDFADATFEHQGVTSRFFRRDGRFYVNTEDANGDLRDFEINYTFGVEPLQQYLVKFPAGGVQALGIAWDTRSRDAGGQRWFHVYGDEPVPAGDELHWTQRSQNWNSMCADCHSTGLVKGYDAENRRYDTTWTDIDVGCESCHGPGSAHVAWAGDNRDGATDPAVAKTTGLTHPLGDRDGGTWVREGEERIAHRSVARGDHNEINTCARCHSRRAQINGEAFHGQALLDDYVPSLLSNGLYHADGQIDDEVFVWGSFLQSRMYQAGVTCSDCHDPHSGKTKADDNTLCTRCHATAAFDNPAHHAHAQNTDAARCVACHMPGKNYMQIDNRRDHSMRIPRPDLSLTLRTPNACNGCHTDESPQWSAAAIKSWRGGDYTPPPHYGQILDAGRRNLPDADTALAALAGDAAQAPLVRASALELLAAYPSQTTLAAIAGAMQDDKPLLRLAALRLLNAAPLQLRAQFALPESYDDLRALRVAAARVLAPLPPGKLPPDRAAELEARFDEYVASETFNADHPAARMNLGNFYVDRGNYAVAEKTYLAALDLDPRHVGALVNLADLYRRQQRDDAAEPLLLKAAARAPDNADVQHALGLLYIRVNDPQAALTALERATSLRPTDPALAYVHAVALNSFNRGAEAIVVLRQALTLHPRNPSLLSALAAIYRDQGDNAAARGIADQLLELNPGDAQARALRDSLHDITR
jgi:predicted CXXCH cytochrome family protein